MERLTFDLSKRGGSFKPMNAVNGGPWHRRYTNDQWRSNFEEYKAARIPYSRNHDSILCGSVYGGPYAHDITAIFPDFDADPYDPASYDFDCTDEAILTTLDAGTETFFRLGQAIEHQIRKHGTIPPRDFKKWAVICEHIIRHYNYGWADGLELNMKYWEIWNEPDLDPEDSANKRTWGGSRAEFFDFYETAAKHLKGCFPKLRIGGPALAGNLEWAEEFLREMRKRNTPIDFFSWHIYGTEPREVTDRAERIRSMLDANGYTDTESILNEWNYIKNWEDQFVSSIETIIGMKGAAFTMACMIASQQSSIDMLMYYDTRPSAFCGVFDYYTYRPLKGYWPFLWYGMFYDREAEIRCGAEADHIYTLCGVDHNGRTLTAVTYYTDTDGAEDKEVQLDFGREGEYEVYLLDEEHSGEKIDQTCRLRFTLHPNTCLLIKEVDG